MNSVYLHSGESLAAAAERFADAWEKAERGEAVAAETHIAFESWAGLAAVLTPRRVALLRWLHSHPGAGVAQLTGAFALPADQVKSDIDELVAAGLIDSREDGLHADYAEIRTAIAM